MSASRKKAAAEVRHDDRHGRDMDGRRRQRERIATPQIEQVGRPEPGARFDRKVAAMREDHGACRRGDLEQLRDALIVRDGSDAAPGTGRRSEAELTRTPVCARSPASGATGFNDEEADESIRMAPHRYRNRLLVAGRRWRSARHATPCDAIELRDPAIGQCLRIAAGAPSRAPPATRLGRDAGVCTELLAAQRSRRNVREEMAMAVVSGRCE